ncbi:hypothetical protein CDEST_14102 [Colletotrichum destructivum]|uniref:Uncharacterized protein n=1 Tax=Colletotrichum destructivum TaxID=34406 RepID=A0AAX4J116_9PEZI|nr:hypothetical protein CDEST_14102 [Colletotrichum destructivum]
MYTQATARSVRGALQYSQSSFLTTTHSDLPYFYCQSRPAAAAPACTFSRCPASAYAAM